jgi:hypothetical protein
MLTYDCTSTVFSVLLLDVCCSTLPETMAGVAEIVCKEVNKSLAERDFPQMRDEQQQLLRGQITAVVDPDNAIYRLMSELKFVPKLPYEHVA